MKNENSYNSAVKDILYGNISGEREEIILSSEDETARAFLCLEHLMGIPVLPVNDHVLAQSKDKFSYLSRTQQVRCLRGTPDADWIQWDLGPFLGLDASGKPYVFIFKENRYYQADPFSGELAPIDRETAGSIVESVTIYSHLPSQEASLPAFFRDSLKNFGKDLLFYFAVVIAAAITAAFIPVCIRYSVAELIPAGIVRSLAVFGIAALLTIAAGALLNIAAGQIKIRIKTKWLSQTYLKLWDRILRAFPAAVSANRASLAGDMFSLLGSLDNLAENVMTGVLYGIQSLGALIIMIVIDPALFGFIAVPIMLYLAAGILLIARRRKASEQFTDSRSRLIRARQEMFSHIETLKNMAKEDQFLYLYAIKYDKHHSAKIEFQRKKNRSEKITALLPLLLQILIYVRLLLLPGSFSASSVTAFISAVSLWSLYSGMFLMSADGFIFELPALRYVLRVLQYDTEEYSPEKGEAGKVGEIEVNDVSFRYDPKAPYAVRHISLKINPGEHIGIVGSSGSGKSTLLRLMIGLNFPDQGEIVYDGRTLSADSLSSFRSRTGVILQDAQLLEGPIWYNISLEEEPDMHKVKQAAEKVGLLEEIEAMPMKFNTLVSHESELVSGGQRQRILLAQALYKNPSVLFLDEATSALDNESQKKVQNTLDALHITTVVVAHRLSTIQNCDRIFVIDHGMLCEEGTYNELMENNGIFAKMAKRNL
ncbi:MAG: ATP-binding cassette domain-containing protein [Eubacteriales bacterium]|nr:ATP-binding cassette domain-containing protein [Eubacteriales bacterium]